MVGKPKPEAQKIEYLKAKKAHYIVGGNTDPKELSAQEVVNAYKNQSSAERGFRFLKDPLFFVASFFLKKAGRIMSLLMVMLLSLLERTPGNSTQPNTPGNRHPHFTVGFPIALWCPLSWHLGWETDASNH